MRFFDLHCDTVTECVKCQKSLYDNGLHVDLNKIDEIDEYIQCVAFWNKNEAEKEYIINLFQEGTKLIEQVNDSKIKLIPTIENSVSLLDNIKNVEFYKKIGIKMATLTWNGDNSLGSGTIGSNSGLTDFGKEVIKEFEKHDIVIDVSHASEKLFWDICENTNTSIVASHSNAFGVCANERNLKDEQIKEIVRRKGLIGINFYKNFLNENPEKASIQDILKHSDYIISLAGEDVLAMGSDFDGADLPVEIKGIESIPKIYNEFIKAGFKECLVDKIFYANAYDFFKDKISV